MRKYLFLLFLIYFPCVIAQTLDSKISLSFENKNLLEVIIEIEEKTDYRFFFDEKWFDSKKLSGEYSQVSIFNILSDILEETNINYFIKDQRIILTQGSIIYDRLSDDFYETKDKIQPAEEDTQTPNPIFYVNSTEKSNTVETILIGKENRQSKQNSYQIAGRVISKQGEPISGLNILLPNQNTGTVTDIDGNYSIKLPKGVNLIEMQALGVDNIKKRLVVYSDGVLNFQLEKNF